MSSAPTAPAVPTAATRRPERGRPVPLLVVGIVLFLGSELMFFASLFGMYFTLRAQNGPGWVSPDVNLDTYRTAFTVVLVLSSFTMQHAVNRLKAGDPAGMRRWIWISFLMGIVFLGGQVNEWISLPFRIHTDSYGSAFYAMTGFHGLHVLAGLLLMIVILGRAARGAYTPHEHAGVEVATYYWHFVDVVWIGLFTVLFVVR